MPKKIIIVRHGETDYNVEKRMQGWLDVPLNENGRMQAIASSKKLTGLHVDAVYSSDLIRARETAKYMAQIVQKEIVVITALRERDMGVFAGWCLEKDPDPVKEKLWAEFSQTFTERDLHWNKHNGESIHQMTHRIKNFMDQIHLSHQDQTIMIVTHGGTINRLLEIYDLKSANEGFRPINNASLLVLHKESTGYRLEEI